MNWYEVNNIEKFDSPALLVYKNRILSNIYRALELVQKSEQLRPHVKTHKLLEVTAMLQAAGINKFKCATIAEAEMLGHTRAEDVLVAYPVVGPKIDRLKELRKLYLETKYSCLIDNLKGARRLSDSFEGNALPVYIDLNVGMNRTGVASEKASELYQQCQALEGIKIIGLHAYDGHIHSSDLSQRATQASEVAELILKVKQEIKSVSGKELKVVAGGSPTFHLHAEHDLQKEVSPGTFVFWDEGYRQTLPDLDFQIAALVATRVISKINQTHICVDLGHKSIAAENPLPRVKFLGIEATPVSQSEEHLVLQVPDATVFSIGQVLYGVPIHICPTVALYEQVRVVDDNKIVETWKVYARDKSVSI